MEQESARNGTGSMTMLCTTIWAILTRVQSMFAKSLEGLVTSLTLAEEELAGHPPRQVSHLCMLFMSKVRYLPISFQLLVGSKYRILLIMFIFFEYNFLTDPNSESRMFILTSLNVYVPRDERFGHLKMSDFLAYGLKSISQAIKPALEGYFDGTEDWDSFKDIDNLYEGGFKLPVAVLDTIRKNVPFEMLKEMFRTDGEQFLKYPVPHVTKGISRICMVQLILFVSLKN